MLITCRRVGCKEFGESSFDDDDNDDDADEDDGDDNNNNDNKAEERTTFNTNVKNVVKEKFAIYYDVVYVLQF